MIAIDTNILVYAHRPGAPFHRIARARIAALAEARVAWAIPWPCVHEFISVVTHSRVFVPPTPLGDAVAQVDYWLGSPNVTLLGEDEHYWGVLRELLKVSRVTGARVHDAHIAALCVAHGVRELWTADRDFNRFPGVATINPLLVDTSGEGAPTYGRVARRRAAGRAGMGRR